mgnify:CR=1 FL=1
MLKAIENRVLQGPQTTQHTEKKTDRSTFSESCPFTGLRPPAADETESGIFTSTPGIYWRSR